MEVVENSLVRGPPLLERFPGSFHTRNTQKGVSRQATIGCPVGFLQNFNVGISPDSRLDLLICFPLLFLGYAFYRGPRYIVIVLIIIFVIYRSIEVFPRDLASW